MKTFSFKEIASQIVTEQEVIQMAKESGLLDENGNPTELAIAEGLLVIEPEDWFTNN